MNDIIVPTVWSIGSANICKERKGSIAQNIIGMRIKNGYNPDYIYYVLISPGMQDKVISLNISWIQPSVKVPHLINLQIPTPSIQEQERIVNIIEKETSQIGSAIEKIEKEIILIEEYQISLIYQAVTGKIQIT